MYFFMLDQEGLPDYWGIETNFVALFFYGHLPPHQEGLPDYWGIETCLWSRVHVVLLWFESGRITRLLGY